MGIPSTIFEIGSFSKGGPYCLHFFGHSSPEIFCQNHSPKQLFSSKPSRTRLLILGVELYRSLCQSNLLPFIYIPILGYHGKRMMKKILFFLIVILLVGCISQQKKSTKQIEKIEWRLWAVNWHPNANEIAVGGTQDTLRIFSSKESRLLKNYPVKGTITKTKWHPTKNILAFSVQGGKSKASIFNVDTGKRIELDSINDSGVRAIDWNKNGEFLATGDYEGIIGIFNEEGKLVKRIVTDQKGIMGLDWHPSKDIIVAVGEKISLYDLSSDSLRHINHREHEVLMLCVDWHPSGKLFVTGDYGDFENNYPPFLQFWTAKGENIKTIEKSKAEYRNLKWSEDGTLLATASEKIRLWDKNGDLELEKRVQNLLWGIDWNSDDSKLVTTDEKGLIYIWNRNLKKIDQLKY